MIRGDLDSPFQVLNLGEVGSTNAEARRLAEAGEVGPVWLSAEVQSKGRGRRGRVWFSDPRDLKATLLAGTDVPPREAAFVSFAAALAAAALLRPYADRPVRLKWPNDVLIGEAKAAGVLVESGQVQGGRLWLAIGIGVNLWSAPKDSERPSVALAERLGRQAAAPPSRSEALRRLDHELRARLLRLRDEGAEALLSEWRANAAGVPGPCLVRLDAETLEGQAEGIEADGALRLRLRDGSLRRITAGDVFLPSEGPT